MELYNKKHEIAIISHRGASGLVQFENTIESFEKAIEIGSDGIECDVRKTLDNVLIMNHNPDIDGLIISNTNYNDLECHCNKIGYHLPTLEETIVCVKGKIFLDLEIKECGYEEEIYDILSKHITTDEYYVRSFYDSAISKFKEINPSVKTILLLGIGNPKNLIKTRLSELFPKRRIFKCKCDFVSPHYKLLFKPYIKKLKRITNAVIIWTVNDIATIEKCKKNKCDGIITNYPDIALEIIQK